MRRLMLTALALTTLAGVGAHVAPAAKPLCVGGPGCYPTLAAALGAATDGDTIHVGAGTFVGGVTILKSVHLVGVSAAASRISGGGPVVTIGSTTAMPTVSIDNLTITGGVTTTDPRAPICGPDNSCADGYPSATALGGGIEAFPGTTVMLTRSAVTGNQARPALTVPSAKAECASGPCPASFGDAAGIDNWGAMTLVDSTISDNHAAGVQSNGGGIVVEGGGSLSLQRSRVTGNSAAAIAPYGRFVSGGGIFVDSEASLSVESSSIDGNTVSLANSFASPFPKQGGNSDQTSAIGGGVFLTDGSTAAIRNSTLNGNAVAVNAPLGQPYGADPALCACGDVALTIDGSTIDRNTMSVAVLSSDVNGQSGATALEADGPTAISNTHVDWNSGTVTTTSGSAAILGAVAFYPGSDALNTFSNGSISHNTATAVAKGADGTAMVSGVGLLNNGRLAVSGSAITGNRGVVTGAHGVAQGGGIWNGQLFGGSTSRLALVDSLVADNALVGDAKATLQGGGIWNQGGGDFTVTLSNSPVRHNTPDQTFGL